MPKRPDIEILTGVRAKEVRFGRVPDGKLRFFGDPDHESTSEVQRDNVPAEPEADVTYRDVGVRWTVRQRIVHPVDDAPDEAP
jgi:hypothetical protein